MLEELGAIAPEEQCLKSKLCDNLYRKHYEPLILELEAAMLSGERTTWKDQFGSGPQLLLSALGLSNEEDEVVKFVNLDRRPSEVIDDYSDAQLVTYRSNTLLIAPPQIQPSKVLGVLMGFGLGAVMYGCHLLYINRYGVVAHMRANRFGLNFLRNLGLNTIIMSSDLRLFLRTSIVRAAGWITNATAKPKEPIESLIVREKDAQRNLLSLMELVAQDDEEHGVGRDEDGFPIGDLEDMLRANRLEESEAESEDESNESTASGSTDSLEPDHDQFEWNDGTESFQCWLGVYEIKILDVNHDEKIKRVVTVRELVNLLRVTASFRQRTHSLLLVLKSKAIAWIKHLRIAEIYKWTLVAYALSIAMVPDHDEITALKNMVYEDKQRLGARTLLESINKYAYRPSMFQWWDAQIGIRFRDWFYDTFTTWVAPRNRQMSSE